MAQWFFDHGHLSRSENWPRTSDIEEDTEHLMTTEVTTVLSNLVEVDILEKHSRSGRNYIRNHRLEKNFFDISSRDWVPYLDKEIERFFEAVEEEDSLAVADGGQTLLDAAKEALSDEPLTLREALLNHGDDFERLGWYDSVVEVIERDDDVEKPESFGAMGIRTIANKYALSDLATRITENQSMSDFST